VRPLSPTKTPAVRTEQIILFRVSGQQFAISSASVQEVRGIDTLSAVAKDISHPDLPKVKHFVRRGENSIYVVNAAMHFGLQPAPPALVFVLRRTRTALLIDGIEKMTSMSRLQALPLALCHEERGWYRGLTALDQTVVPVVKPDGFLTAEELFILDASLSRKAEATEASLAGDTAETSVEAEPTELHDADAGVDQEKSFDSGVDAERRFDAGGDALGIGHADDAAPNTHDASFL
jgi:chemotaxis signal transduction protein